MPAKVLVFKGIINLPLSTYTTSYPFDQAGWAWSKSLLPLDFNATISANPGVDPPPGFAGHIFDTLLGPSRFTGGTVGPFDNRYAKALYTGNGHMQVIARNSPVFSDKIYGMNFTFPFGFNFSVTPLWTTLLTVTGTNTGAWSPYVDAGYQTDFGIFGSYYTNPGLVNRYVQFNGDNITPLRTSYMLGYFNSQGPFDAAGNVSEMLSDPFMPGWFWIVQDINSQVPGLRLMHTDFSLGGFVRYTFSAQNPTGFDVTAFLNQDSATRTATTCGFLYLTRTVATINGVLMNGFGILVNADFTEYRILNFVPQDALAASWNTFIGTYTGKFDRLGVLYMFNGNFPAVIFSAFLPIYRGSIPSTLCPIPHNPGFFK